MFAEAEFEWTVVVQPDAMKSSAHIQRAVILALLRDFQDLKCTALGYYVAVTTLENIGEGRLWERRGCAALPVRFRCLVFTLVKHEYVFAVVSEVNATGLVCQCGPVENIIIPEKLMREEDLEGKYLEGVGYRFVNATASPEFPSHWFKSSNGTKIKVGDVVRVKIIMFKWESAKRVFTVMGSLREDYTGLDERWSELEESPNTTGIGDSPSKQVDATDDQWEAPDTNETNDFEWG